MSINKFQICIILIIITFINLSASGKDEFKFERLSLEKGAALNLTYCMLQDHKGFLWFGTMYGLVKYDGKDFRIYKNDPDDPNSISFDDIISLYEDSKYNIWIGTWGGGLNKFNPETEKFTRYISTGQKKGEVSDNIIWAINEDNKGNIWFGTETGGLNKYNPEKDSFITYIHSDDDIKSISANTIRCLYKDNNGNLWIGNQKGLSEYNFKTNDFTNYSINDKSNKQPINVSAILGDNNHNFLVGTPIGLFKFETGSGKFSLTDIDGFRDKFIFTLCNGKANTFWVGTNGGLYHINIKDGSIKNYLNETDNPFSLSGNNIVNLLTDKSGILWINSYGTGINKLNAQTSQFTSYSVESGNKNSLSNNSVNTFCISENSDIWIGTSQGLNKFDEKTGLFNRYYPGKKSSFRIISLLSDGNLIWIGTIQGLKLFNINSTKFESLPASVKENKLLNLSGIRSLLKSNKEIYIGTYGNGLYIYNNETSSLNHYTSTEFWNKDKHADYIMCLYRDKLDPQIIWIGTYGGLIKMNIENKSFVVFKHILNDDKSLSNDYVFSILRDSGNILWIGTANGLNRFNEKPGNFIHYFEKEGLPNSVINSIVEDDNKNLWISTNYGISEFNSTDKKFKNYDMKDGLQNNLFFNHSSLKDINGNIYFGGANGFDIIYPSLLLSDDYKPGVYITSVEKNNDRGGKTKIIPGNGNITLDYNENFINIRFISLDYNNPSKNYYIYKLIGIDNNWVNAGNTNYADYTNLSPGEYVFHLKGSNSYGVFNSEEVILNITILPPFWKTTWFNAAVIVFLILFSYLLYRIKVRQKIYRALEIEKIREEESEKLRKKTAADFHDELGHHLTRISLLSEMIKRKMGTSSKEITGLLNKISLNSNELYEGTKDFIWAIDPQRDSLYELMIRLKDFGDDLFGDTDVLFEVNGLEDPSLKERTLTMDWKRQLALIFKEGMNNSLRHSRSKKISINSRVNSDNVEIVLSDNGSGFLPEMNFQGNGIKNMQKRAGKLSAILEVVSSPGKGTQIYFKGRMPGKAINYN